VLYHGGFAPGRGLEALIAAWSNLLPGNAALFLRGPDNDHRRLCMKLAAESGLLDRGVYFLDPVSEDELTPSACEADIGIIPYLPTILNHVYCCPNKLSQYMHAGLMVVANGGLSYVSQVIRESGAGLCYDPDAPSELARTLQRAIDDASLRETCRRKAVDYAHSRFHWAACFSPMAEAYSALQAGIRDRSALKAPRRVSDDGAGRKRTVLVLYYTRGVFPLRDAIRTHLYCWRHYARHRILYVNVALWIPRSVIEQARPDVIIFHNLFLGMRWSPEIFRRFTRRCRFLADYPAVKIAMPQDEFLHSALLNEFCRDFGIAHLFTCADEPDWPVIYNELGPSRIALRQVLTGYIDPRSMRRIEKLRRRASPSRDIDIGYRAWKAEYWLGEHATHKVRVAEEFQRAASAAGLRTDISLRDEDTLTGDAWYEFLLRCKATVGVEGGASVLDRDGSIRTHVMDYVRDHPAATFEETREQCFRGRDHEIALQCVSPRHFEACATETLQLLIEGKYNGVLRPWRHYVPVKPDYSNVEAALRTIADETRVREITSNALREIACSPKWTYRTFVGEIERDIIDGAPLSANAGSSPARLAARARLRALERAGWLFIRFERWVLNGAIRNGLARRAYDFLFEYPGRF
jgi:hypothetical protein